MAMGRGNRVMILSPGHGFLAVVRRYGAPCHSSATAEDARPAIVLAVD